MQKNDKIRLQHMLDAAHEALSFARGRTLADLQADRMLALALVKEIEIIGEAANRISASTREKFPGIPWADITGMRNRLIHAYFDINLEILWRTVQGELTPLVDELTRIRDGEFL